MFAFFVTLGVALAAPPETAPATDTTYDKELGSAKAKSDGNDVDCPTSYTVIVENSDDYNTTCARGTIYVASIGGGDDASNMGIHGNNNYPLEYYNVSKEGVELIPRQLCAIECAVRANCLWWTLQNRSNGACNLWGGAIQRSNSGVVKTVDGDCVGAGVNVEQCVGSGTGSGSSSDSSTTPTPAPDSSTTPAPAPDSSTTPAPAPDSSTTPAPDSSTTPSPAGGKQPCGANQQPPSCVMACGFGAAQTMALAPPNCTIVCGFGAGYGKVGSACTKLSDAASSLSTTGSLIASAAEVRSVRDSPETVRESSLTEETLVRENGEDCGKDANHETRLSSVLPSWETKLASAHGMN